MSVSICGDCGNFFSSGCGDGWCMTVKANRGFADLACVDAIKKKEDGDEKLVSVNVVGCSEPMVIDAREVRCVSNGSWGGTDIHFWERPRIVSGDGVEKVRKDIATALSSGRKK